MRRLIVPGLFLLVGLLAGVILIGGIGFNYAYEPARDLVISRTRLAPEA